MAKTYRINPDLPALLGQAGYSIRSFCKTYNISDKTIRAALNPKDYPDRIGGIYPVTAWKIARAYAQAVGLDDAAAYKAIIEEFDDGREAKRTKAGDAAD